MSSLELLNQRERTRVAERFLRLRPWIAGVGAVTNAKALDASTAPDSQKLSLLISLGGLVALFFAEAAWLSRNELTQRWLIGSLGTTLLVLGVAASMSGGLTSPVVPLFFAPVVVGFAAFARTKSSLLLFVEAVLTVFVLGLLGPSSIFPVLPQPTLGVMFGVSSLTALLLLAVGVVGLVDAHARVASELNRVREDLLQEAERRAQSVEHLGAQVAHEVKNPLAAAKGLVQLVERRVEDPRDRKRLAVVGDEIDRALMVLGDYLSFARPLSDLKLDSVDLLDLLEDVAAVLEARVRGKALTLRVAGEHLEAVADRQRLRDALLNLALNAVTALPPGGELELEVARRAESAVLLVRDDGPGMSSELLAKLGRPFMTETDGGTGLGILLAQSVARQHGGSLRFESAPNTGARAILELPLRRAGQG